VQAREIVGTFVGTNIFMPKFITFYQYLGSIMRLPQPHHNLMNYMVFWLQTTRARLFGSFGRISVARGKSCAGGAGDRSRVTTARRKATTQPLPSLRWRSLSPPDKSVQKVAAHDTDAKDTFQPAEQQKLGNFIFEERERTETLSSRMNPKNKRRTVNFPPWAPWISVCLVWRVVLFPMNDS
jgi:hypothetical protein